MTFAPYLLERGAPGGNVLHFYHRQVERSACDRFLADSPERVLRHRRLADYFANESRHPYFLESLEEQRKRTQPPYSARPANLRKVTELPEQLFKLAREAQHNTSNDQSEKTYQQIEDLFLTLDFLEANNEGGRVFELAEHFANALDLLPPEREELDAGRAEQGRRKLVRLINEAVRRDIHFIARHAANYPQGLFQSLWNLGWWYDCSNAAAYYQNGRAPGDASSRPLSELLECWCGVKEANLALVWWVRSHRPPRVHLGTAQLAVFQGHKSHVKSVMFSPDGTRIASGSADKTVRVWDANGSAELAVRGCHKSNVECVAYSPNGWQIVSGVHDATARVLDAESGSELAILRGHEHWIESVAYSPDGGRIVTGSWDKTIRVWDAESGGCLEVENGSGDVQVTAVGADNSRFRRSTRGSETIIEADDGGAVFGWISIALHESITLPDARKWGGRTGNQLVLISLEGAGD